MAETNSIGTTNTTLHSYTDFNSTYFPEPNTQPPNFTNDDLKRYLALCKLAWGPCLLSSCVSGKYDSADSYWWGSDSYPDTSTGECYNRDTDGDGFDDTACDGTDCNDGNADINPDAEEIRGNSIDENCDGVKEEALQVGCEGGYATIQAAVDASHSGDTIEICEGAYNESIVLNGKDLTFKAKSGTVAITGNGSDRAFTLSNGTYTFEGLLIAGGHSSSTGGAMLVKSGATVYLSDNQISYNESAGYGAALAVEQEGSVIIYSGTFTGNYSDSEVSGIYNEGSVTLSPDDGDIKFEDSPLFYLDNGAYFYINEGTYDVIFSESYVLLWNFYVGEDSVFWAYGPVSSDSDFISIYLKEAGAAGYFSLEASGFITIDPSGESFEDTETTRAACYYNTGTCDFY